MSNDVSQLIDIAKTCDIDAQLSTLSQRTTAFCDFFSQKAKEANSEQEVLFYTILQIVTSVYLEWLITKPWQNQEQLCCGRRTKRCRRQQC